MQRLTGCGDVASGFEQPFTASLGGRDRFDQRARLDAQAVIALEQFRRTAYGRKRRLQFMADVVGPVTSVDRNNGTWSA